jgi:hypothetical protein
MKTLPISDEFAIRGMFARYVHLLDKGDADGWAGLFTEDGTWTRLNVSPCELGGSGMPAVTYRGREQLVQLVNDTAGTRFRGRSRHQMTDIVIEEGDDPDDARGLSRALITSWLDGPGRIAMVGDYSLEFKRTPNGWRIRSIACSLLPD